jgi:hypothetical protein
VKTAVNVTGKTLSTGGKYAPVAMQGADVVDKVGQYQRGEIKAEDVMQSVAGLTTSAVGMKTTSRMGRNGQTHPQHGEGAHPEGHGTVKSHPHGQDGVALPTKTKAEGAQPQHETHGQKAHEQSSGAVQQKSGEHQRETAAVKSPRQLAHEAHLQKALPKSARVPVEVNHQLEGNTVQVHYVKDAKGRIADVHIQAGPKATPRDIELHARTVKSMKRYSGMSFHAQKLKDRIDGWVSKNGTPPVGSKAWEAKLEIQKLPNIIADRTKRLSSGDLTPQQRTKLEQEVTHLEHQLDGYKKDFKAMDKDPGKGFVAAIDRDKIKRVLDSEVDADGNPSANKRIREAAVDLRSQESVKIEIENQRNQVSQGAGKSADNPLIASGPDARMASAEAIANRERPARTSQIISLSSGKSQESLVLERQTYSTSPGHIHVAGGGKYQNLPRELNHIMESTGANPTIIAQAMQQIARTGQVPKLFAQDPKSARQLLALSRLVFDVEPGRGLAASVTLPINLNLLREGHLSSEQALVILNQMAPQGAVRVAHGSDKKLGFDRVGEYKKPASANDVDLMLATEREGLSHWLHSRSQGKDPIFSNEKELKELLKSSDLKSHLVQEVKRFYGQGD